MDTDNQSFFVGTSLGKLTMLIQIKKNLNANISLRKQKEKPSTEPFLYFSSLQDFLLASKRLYKWKLIAPTSQREEHKVKELQQEECKNNNNVTPIMQSIFSSHKVT